MAIFTSIVSPAFGDALPVELQAQTPPADAIWLDSLNLTPVSTEGKLKASVTTWGRPITLADVEYPHGLSFAGTSEMTIDLHGSATRFDAMVGVDDEAVDRGAIIITVVVDGKTAFDSGVMHGGDDPKPVSVDLTNAKKLTLRVTSTEASHFGDHGDFAGAMIRFAPGVTEMPETFVAPPVSQAPIYVAVAAEPAIHGPRTVGFSSGRPFVYHVPATGQAPLKFAASGLPTGLTIDVATGAITGKAAAGTAAVTISVSNSRGKATRSLSLICGERKLGQTPPMGWYSYGVYGDSLTDAKVRDAADVLVETGLAAHGYQYVVIGDSWQGGRDTDGNIHPNARFPDMKALAAYVHGKGLKFGLYTAATPSTCSGFAGSGGHEEQDARSYADWGVDYVTADWCPDAAKKADGGTKTATTSEIAAQFTALGTALAKTDRDIFYAVTISDKMGGDDVARAMDAAASTRPNSFESAGGLYDSSAVIAKYAVDRLKSAPASSAGNWSFPGMLFVGRTGYPKLKYTALTPAEQMAQMTMWSMLEAPLFFSSDLEHLNPNALNHDTTALLTNDEVLDINQNALGKPPALLFTSMNAMTWTKPLSDGRVAVALFNLSKSPMSLNVAWTDLGLAGTQPIRDLWTHKDLTPQSVGFESNVPAHGVTFIVVGKSNAK